jgi:hypothetical protein
VAWLKDIMDHVDLKFPESETGFKLRVDGIILTFDEIMQIVI